MVLALNTISGQIADVSPKILEHPKFKDILEVVEPGTKPYVAELYKSGTTEQKAARKPKKESAVVEFTVDADEDGDIVVSDVTVTPEIEEEN